tara:strand:- start:56 stop:574 length:519 start_codon:yes stop_codon:yes gene_type:complete
MEVNKILNTKIERDCVFVTGKLNIPTDYFIQEIEKGITKDNNESFKTNLVSPMTNYEYFNNDKEMSKILMPIYDLIEQHNLNKNDVFFLKSSWGFKMGFSHYTIKHKHDKSFLSGAIMLNEHDQTLCFPEIDEQLKCEPGNFVLFSGFLNHYTKRNLSDSVRYGLSFNINII